ASCKAAVAMQRSVAAHNGAGFRVSSRLPGRWRRIIGTKLGSAMMPPKITRGITAKNTQCQLRCSVSQAAAGGPTNDGKTQAVEMQVNILGCWGGRKTWAT